MTERVRRKPYSVVLLDEIEKAHPDVFNVLLQVLDSGHLTDSLGRKVDFKNTLLIMTSNLGARQIGLGKNLGFHALEFEEDYKSMEKKVLSELKKTFNPEFLNRVDDVVVFRALDRKDVLEIIEILLKEVRGRLAEKNLDLIITQQAKEFVVNEGYSPMYGARPLKRAIQKHLENPLSEALLEGRFTDGSVIQVDIDDSGSKEVTQVQSKELYEKHLVFTELTKQSAETKKR